MENLSVEDLKKIYPTLIIKERKRTLLENGKICPKKQHEYYVAWKENNPETYKKHSNKPKPHKYCDVCERRYTYNGYQLHFKNRRHLENLEKQKKINELNI